ncbi:MULTISPECIES: ABC transporter permease [unclassified Chelatococcus]|uniref:ABC transporter permease n=1 Tax=unclassified Chelatococcus TaxID=2638111 RepID=UPI001BCF5287|nr:MULTISPECIES: ABC transporter permease [unclassified Chelatococcus]MBS7700138.1 ABC transporter permease [Chelatococcus sp. YT9]MBX3556831.1 ABC transporter permease [Chelatococcus sp.]
MKSLAPYVMRRLGHGVITVAAIIVLNFIILHLAPGDTVDLLAGEFGAADPQYLADLRARFGLDQPLYIQLGQYFWNVLQLDLGYSFRNATPVLNLIVARLPATLILMLTAILVAFTAGLLLGVISARRVNTLTDDVISVLALLFYATPLFWLGLMGIVLFSVKLGWLPTGGMYTIGGRYNWLQSALDVGRHLILPAMTLALYHMAIYTRLMRASMLEVYNLDYIRTARSKGLMPRRIAFRHVLPNAVLPMVTMVGIQIGTLLGGAVMIETVFNWPGLGRLAFDAVFQRDYNLLLGTMLFASSLVVVINIFTDLIYAVLDPRIGIS